MKAKEMYLNGKKLVEIASQLNLPEGTVRRWKSTYKWGSERSLNKSERSQRRKGGQPGNRNAVGHGGTGPPGNQNAVKHGLFSKYFTADTRDIYEELQSGDPLELLWHNILFLQAEVLRSQKIMHVKDEFDVTESKIGYTDSVKSSSEQWEVQQAWDKQGNYLRSLSRAQAELRNMIKDYLELEGKNKADASAAAKDWKAAIIDIAKRRAQHE
ncbi:phage terminase small subunit [Blautia producta]|uniref:phage terminase small subunit n=1 Tax=Blautia producta TaxID=33035 RepID=UPI001FAB2343|nr:phage terminase small subunit [Blautia producta]